MQTAIKIEMYDAGVVLLNDPLHDDIEYSGYDYSEEFETWHAGSWLLDLLHIKGVLRASQANESYPVVAQRVLRRDVYCSKLLAETTQSGTLKIKATVHRTYLVDRELLGPKDRHKPEIEGDIEVTYSGAYTVFWAEEPGSVSLRI